MQPKFRINRKTALEIVRGTKILHTHTHARARARTHTHRGPFYVLFFCEKAETRLKREYIINLVFNFHTFRKFHFSAALKLSHISQNIFSLSVQPLNPLYIRGLSSFRYRKIEKVAHELKELTVRMKYNNFKIGTHGLRSNSESVEAVNMCIRTSDNREFSHPSRSLNG